MKAVIGIYESHEEAIAALRELQKSGYPTNQLSIMGKADLINNHIHLTANDSIERTELSIGVAAGTAVGILTGVGVFAIPGFGILYAGGAFLGAIAGIWAGYVSGGLLAIFTNMLGIDEKIAVIHEKHLFEGKFLVFAQGNDDEIRHARHILHTEELPFKLNVG